MLELRDINYTVSEKTSGKTVKKEIIKNFSYRFNDGEMTVITGPNGSGKSTLAKIIMGIEKPTSGTIIFNNKDITNLEINKRAKLGISFAFQQPVKFKGLTVKDLIRIASGKEVDVNTACKYLSNVGLCARNYIDRVVDGSLSGGELKRIEIALCEAKKSSLVIFDEPEAGIDLWSFSSLISVFERIKTNNKNSSLIVISHQERLIEKADKVVLIEDGKIAKCGTPSEMKNNFNIYNVCNKLKGECN